MRERAKQVRCAIYTRKSSEEGLEQEHYRVPALMDDFVNQVNRHWDDHDAVFLATFVLWRLNNIHPFINGNGRTARLACYFVLCLKNGGFPRGTILLPELIRRDRDEYCAALQKAHDAFAQTGTADLDDLHAMLVRLLEEQLASDPAEGGDPD